MEHDQRYGHDIPFVPHQGHWQEAPGYHPHHHSSQHGYPVAGFTPMTPSYDGQVVISPRQDQYHTFSYPPYPSMLAPSYVSNMTSHAVQYVPLSSPASTSATNVAQYTTKAPQQQAPIQRKMLSDADRRNMCQYHIENPSKKQTEIGEIFGVERSTVSKVLRQKERYLANDEEGNNSPVKKPKGKLTELERALVNWVRKQEKEGIELTDDMIKHRATCFSYVTRNGAAVRENIYDPQWLKEFKSKNKIGLARTRKESVAKKESPAIFSANPVPPSSNEAPNDISPSTLAGFSSPGSSAFNPTDTHTNSDRGMFGQRSTVYHSQSNNSLSSAYGATSVTTFSTADQSVHTPLQTPETIKADTVPNGTPYFATADKAQQLSPEGDSAIVSPATGPSTQIGTNSWSQYNMLPSQLAAQAKTSIASHDLIHNQSLSHQPRLPNQEFSATSTHPTSTQLSTDVKLSDPNANSHVGSPMNGATSLSTKAALQSRSPAVSGRKFSTIGPGTQQVSSPSKDEAFAALGTIMEYFQHQPTHGGVQPQDIAVIVKLRETIRQSHLK